MSFESDFPEKEFPAKQGPLSPKERDLHILPTPQGVARAGLKAAAIPFTTASRAAGKYIDVPLGIKTPEQAESRAQMYGPLMRDVVLGSMIPFSQAKGWLGLGKNMLQSGAISGAQTGIETGGSLPDMGKSAGIGVGLVPVLRGLMYPFKLAANAISERAAASSYKAKKAIDKAFDAQMQAAQKAGYEKEVTAARTKYAELLRESRNKYKQGKATAQRDVALAEKEQSAAYTEKQVAHATGSAGIFAQALQTNVPTLKGYSSTPEGLYDMVYGRGQEAMHKMYDTVMQEVVAKGAGKPVQVSLDTLKALGLPTKPIIAKGGGDSAAEDLSTRLVDAADLAKAATGAWKKAPDAYREAVEALDSINVGNPKARAQYKYWQGISQFLDKAKAFKGNKQFDPDAVVGAMNNLKKLGELSRRGIGHGTEGPAQASRGGPLAPQSPPLWAPVIPPYVKPKNQYPIPEKPTPLTPTHTPTLEEQGYKQSPLTGPAIGGALGHIAGYGAGIPLGHPMYGSIVGGAIGALSGKAAFPGGITTQAPLSPALTELFTRYPSLLAVLSQRGVNYSQQSTGE